MAMRFDTLLIANRGEIAIRVCRTARSMGLKTIAVYSDADAGSPHVAAADMAIRLGPASSEESYLNIDRVIAVAKQTGAGAIHPGYGFLSENAAFAQACEKAGLVFVGAPAEVIRMMGDKAAAKERMANSGVPVVPGYQGKDQSDQKLFDEAKKIGFPLMIKASAGGGGKGMRLVSSAGEFEEALSAARRESMSAFGSDVVLLERAVVRPRHVEIQILADEYGHVVAFGERDCSTQRRHQKVIEEAPCPVLQPNTRARMMEVATVGVREIGYRGAGTLEFLLDSDGAFWFMEMNTRLQVEHAVTELITGIDLVEWQLRIAQGEPLALRQDDIRFAGHAIEARLYAEDPGSNFLPGAGRVESWSAPDEVRCDAGVASGTTVTPYYDPMLAKFIAHGADREEARRRLISALERSVALGLATNRTFLIDLLKHRTFVDAQATTAFIDEARIAPRTAGAYEIAVGAALLFRAAEHDANLRSPGLGGWTSRESSASTRFFEVNKQTHEIHLLRGRDGLDIEVMGEHFVFDPGPRLRCNGAVVTVESHIVNPDRILLSFPGVDVDMRNTSFDPPSSADVAGNGVLSAPMHGLITGIFADEGADVELGDRIITMEAMKMEHTLRADVVGRVRLSATVGAQVAAGEILARIES